MGQVITSSRFYFYGRTHFTRIGVSKIVLRRQSIWLQCHSGRICPNSILLQTKSPMPIWREKFFWWLEQTAALDSAWVNTLQERRQGCIWFVETRWAIAHIVTQPANPVTNNQERAENARASILRTHANADCRLIIADCGLASGVRQISEEIKAAEKRLDGLVCNAGALLASKEVSKHFTINDMIDFVNSWHQKDTKWPWLPTSFLEPTTSQISSCHSCHPPLTLELWWFLVEECTTQSNA